MKILLATSAAVPTGGGIASYNQELVRLFGDENEIYCLTDSNEHSIYGYVETYSTYGKTNNDFSYAKRIIVNINKSNYDLIINSDSAFIPVISPFLKTPIISISHFVNGLIADRAGFNSDYISRIISLSYYGKDYLEKSFSIKDNNKVKVIYNFVHPKVYSVNKVLNEPINIVYPGGTSVKKSVDVVVKTIYKLMKYKLPFKFIWIGQTTLPGAKYSILSLRNSFQLFHDERIEIKGLVTREEAEDIIASANIFLLPSRGEGCPMTLLEAMRVGCIPIVSDARHGSRELIEKCRCGFIVKQGDSDELAKTIHEIITHHSFYLDVYSKTKLFSESFLNYENWKQQMTEVISYASGDNKKSIPLTENNFNESVMKLKKLDKKNRRKEMLNSLIVRLKLEYYFLRYRKCKDILRLTII